MGVVIVLALILGAIIWFGGMHALTDLLESPAGIAFAALLVGALILLGAGKK